ncbi:hypothetical protein LTR10_024028 [Elasticomyces elasticus]|uniref:Uncharacterized protein n=1 Tax=Exophiala sideris TaxID=1016849 RepID=A0ABR0JM21_9EURO|nr:hypothetical protein LTR10_024028 [Elasticomyces elasticus]KAK5036641.1 hypothetical protein LTS07_002368 [Exophiala sideris]KAK5041527.1 hypothetical protein LTR13_002194 [Exophiala sideris]KAK5067025.1 hypothetical protein LTR69_002373 [Exophiala sideris]KAK5185083.1 hypothetical protein LTR44_002929 [Eurotiomycetes sp. CCFEE 6388]
MPARRSGGAKATPSSAKSHKRQLSETPGTITPSSRVSKRLKESTEKTKVTPTKSKYFEEPDLDVSDNSADEVQDSGYEDEDASMTEPPTSSEDEDEDDYDSDEDVKRHRPKKKANSMKTGIGGASAIANEKELWRPGVQTGLGPGKQVFIAKPKPRGDGGIRYVPERIHPNTMAFLKDLKNNNDREWLKMHDPDYRQSWKDWESFVETLTEKISEIDETIPELPPKDLKVAQVEAGADRAAYAKTNLGRSFGREESHQGFRGAELGKRFEDEAKGQSPPSFASCVCGWLGTTPTRLLVGTGASSKICASPTLSPAIKRGMPPSEPRPSAASSMKSIKAYVRIRSKEARLLISVSAPGVPVSIGKIALLSSNRCS